MMNATTSIRPNRHPFREQLGICPPAPPKSPAREKDDSDIKLFVLSYTAFFICFYTFLM